MSDETLDGGAVQQIERLTLATTFPVTIDGREYSRVPLHDPRKADPEPQTIGFATLTSLVEYTLGLDRSYVLNPKREQPFVHVESPTRVRLVTSIFGEFNQRVTLARAEAIVPKLGLGEWHDPETFNIHLQAHFEASTGRAAALALVGGLRTEAVQTIEDDGVSQMATARKGLNLAQNVKVPNPISLRPFRTFTEVAQVESPFVLRLRGGGNGSLPTCALFEADGGLWRLDATQRIKAWLVHELGSAWKVVG